ncbi:hypothetical protein ACF0H5_001285 [Mactra antiquata]
MASVLALVLALSLCNVYARRTVDLTHVFDENAPKYPLENFGIDSGTFSYFNMTTLAEQFFGDTWIAFRTYEFYEHLGTHMDAPFHFGSGRQYMSEIPPERLIGPGVVIDIKDKAGADPDYTVTVQDIQGLLTVSVVGVDTPSVDPAQNSYIACHTYLQPNDVPLLEYVANLDSIPVRGTTIVLGAIKLRYGSGGPTRIFAFIDEDDDEPNSANELQCTACFVFMIMSLYRM